MRLLSKQQLLRYSSKANHSLEEYFALLEYIMALICYKVSPKVV